MLNNVFAFVTIGSIVFVGVALVIMRVLLERNRLRNLEHELDEEKKPEKEPAELKTVSIYDGMVTRSITEDGTGSYFHFEVNTEKFPDFQTVDEVVEYADDFLKVHQPRILIGNLVPYGAVCGLNQYVADRQILWFLFAKIWKLTHPKTDNKQEQDEG